MEKLLYSMLTVAMLWITWTPGQGQINTRPLPTNFSYYYHDDLIQPEIASGIVLVGLENPKSIPLLQLRNAGLEIDHYMWGHAVVKGPSLSTHKGVPNEPGAITKSRQVAMQQLLESPGVTFVHPIFTFENGLTTSYLNELLLRLHDDQSASELSIFLAKHGWEIVKAIQYRKGAYLIRSISPSSEEYFSMARKLYESGLCRYAEPNFIGKSPTHYIPNDPQVGNQYCVDNAGIVYGGGAPGIVGADMRLEEAWNVTRGCEDIVIAIIDDGVELTHPDLMANLLPGYDATGGGSNGGHTSGDGHGTFCAGTAAAVGDNGIGVAGVAFDCSILPVRAFSTDSSNTAFFVDAIDWAWNNGADVLSNSWGWASSSSIEDAIDDAIDLGRGGLGCVVLASSGNSNHPSTLGFPARYSPVIAVGASNACDQRKRASSDTTGCSAPNVIPGSSGISCDSVQCWGSNYGNSLDIVAPGQYVRTTTTGAGYGWFQGTSAACPNAAGVAALILSINPNLTESGARNILELTCRKGGSYSYTQTVGHPNGDWNNQMGYGIVNGQVAVQQALISASLYFQNITFGPMNFNFLARYQIFAGTNVNNNAPPGQVVVSAGADVKFDAGWRVILEPGFSAVTGSKFRARNVNIAVCPIDP